MILQYVLIMRFIFVI